MSEFGTFSPDTAIEALRAPGRVLNDHECKAIAHCIGKLAKKLAATQQRQLQEAGGTAPWPACNPWALAVDEALVECMLDCTTADSDPEACVKLLVETSIEMALDPAISMAVLTAGAELLTWIRVSERLPDADLTVNIATPSLDEPTWLGFYDGSSWYTVDGTPLDDGVVEAWAPMLVGLGHSAAAPMPAETRQA